MNRILSLLLFTTLLTACAGKPTVPDWIDGNSSQYPDEKFLVGRGLGDSPAIARDRARADLAKIFQVAVVEKSEDLTSHAQAGMGKQAQQEYTRSVSREVHTRTEQIVEGVVIAEQWSPTDSGKHHALAVLNRSKTARALRSEISRLDSATTASLQAARGASDLITQIGAAQRAVNAQLARRANQKLLRVVARGGGGVAEQYNVAQLVGDLEELLQRMRIVAVAESKNIDDLAGIAAGAVNNAGFATANAANANYILDTRTRLVQAKDKQGWYWLRGTLEIKLVRKSDEVTVGTYSWPIKVAAQQDGVAAQRARQKFEQLLNSELRQVIIDFGKTGSTPS